MSHRMQLLIVSCIAINCLSCTVCVPCGAMMRVGNSMWLRHGAVIDAFTINSDTNFEPSRDKSILAITNHHSYYDSSRPTATGARTSLASQHCNTLVLMRFAAQFEVSAAGSMASSCEDEEPATLQADTGKSRPDQRAHAHSISALATGTEQYSTEQSVQAL